MKDYLKRDNIVYMYALWNLISNCEQLINISLIFDLPVSTRGEQSHMTSVMFSMTTFF